jgi:hypothetical protein
MNEGMIKLGDDKRECEKNDNKGCETFFIMIVKEIENII